MGVFLYNGSNRREDHILLHFHTVERSSYMCMTTNETKEQKFMMLPSVDFCFHSLAITRMREGRIVWCTVSNDTSLSCVNCGRRAKKAKALSLWPLTSRGTRIFIVVFLFLLSLRAGRFPEVSLHEKNRFFWREGCVRNAIQLAKA